MTAALTTFGGGAHPWMCDVNGHVNVRHYMAMFDDASFQVLGHVAGADPVAERGWADVRAEIDYVEEIRAGELLTVTSQIERIGNTSLVLLHTLTTTGKTAPHARARVVSVRFDLTRRQATALLPDERTRAEAFLLQREG